MRAPKEINAAVRAFSEELAGHRRAVAITLNPLPDAEALDCFSVVERVTADQAGERVLGWRIWENPGFWLEAEFHAVWRRPDGSLVDLTPVEAHFERMVFVEDAAASYDGRQVNNRFWPLSGHPAIGRHVAAQAQHFEFMNRGARADQHGPIKIPAAELPELESIENRAQEALLRLAEARTWTSGRNDRCPCNSGRKYKKCCMTARIRTR